MTKKDRRPAAVVKEESVFLSYGERCALRRMIAHFDDGLVGHKQAGNWNKAFDGMAERLGLRPRDPFGDQPVRISDQEAEALRSFQRVYNHDAMIFILATSRCGRMRKRSVMPWSARANRKRRAYHGEPEAVLTSRSDLKGALAWGFCIG
jgi:hypothetical protein